MVFRGQQKQVDDFVQDYEKPYWSPLGLLAQLIEEVGEIARIFNHKYSDKVKKPTEKDDDLEGEIGDAFFALICLANAENIDLDRALQKTLHKSQTRDKDRFEKKA
jgi:NTP pyrophosphatase (non-canonical NTP hydrolase)